MTSGTVVAVVVVADIVVAAVYLMVDVIEVPFAVNIPKKIRVTWHTGCFTQYVSMEITIYKGI